MRVLLKLSTTRKVQLATNAERCTADTSRSPPTRSGQRAPGQGSALLVFAQQLFDLSVGDLLPTVDAFGVAAQQDLDAITRALSHLGRVHAGVQPRRQRRVPKVVGSGSE